MTKKRKALTIGIFYITATLIVVIWLIPFFIATFTAMKSMDELMSSRYWWMPPQKTVWENFSSAWHTGNMKTYFWNTFVVTVPSVESVIQAVMVYLLYVGARFDEVLEARQALEQEAARLAMRLARDGEVDVVVKGAVPTATFLRAALDREVGVRTGRLLSHVGVYDLPGFGRLLLVSDGGVVVAPDLYQKAEIVQNAIDVAHRLGIGEPKVAVLAAAETVNPKVPATLDAASLSKMAERGQIRGGIVDGPLALDNAISESSGRQKGIRSPVLGMADVLIVPDIEAGNLLGKAMLYLGGGEMAGVVVGGRVPLVVTSRSGSRATREVSIALGVLLAGGGAT